MIDAWSPVLDRWPCSTKTAFIQVGNIEFQIQASNRKFQIVSFKLPQGYMDLIKLKNR
jgi:hypothetical protein